MLSELRYSAQIVGQDFSNQQVLKAEVTRLKGQSQKFNSITIIDKNAFILESHPRPYMLIKKNNIKLQVLPKH